jgi:hypothetical protein
VLNEHRVDLLPAVHPTQPNLPAGYEAEEKNERRAFARQRALDLHAASTSSCKHSIVFVVRKVFHCAFGQAKKVNSSSPPSRKTLHHARTTLAPGALEGSVSGTSRFSTGCVDDAMEVISDRRQGVLGVLRCSTLKAPEFVDATALHGGSRADLTGTVWRSWGALPG